MEFDEDIGHIISQTFQRKFWVCTALYLFKNTVLVIYYVVGIECIHASKYGNMADRYAAV